MTVDDVWGLKGKVAIVTGGGSDEGIGNGRAASILLAQAGAHVLVVDRDLSLAEKTVAMIEAEGGSAAAASYNVLVEAESSAMVDEAVRRWGRLDCLDNNVGGGVFGTVVDVPASEWQRALDINLNHVFLTCKFAVPAMIKSGGGSIVNISSMAALRPHGLTPYTTAKGAVHALTQAMAVDHGPSGIRVNCVVPGPMHTPVMYRFGMNEKTREERRKASLLGKEGTGWDIGAAVRFFLSDQAKYITGQILCVDGGLGLQSPKRDT
jgi:NAD(P)-dependent dehydrogenase (short-subunit alcohol dehydrogenase family)